jgi:hypothetical protein
MVLDDPRTVIAQPDNQPIGPSTFFVRGDTITIPDRVNDVLGIYRDNKRVDAVTMPDVACCIDLLVKEDHYWLLDGDDQVFEYVRKPGADHLTELNRSEVRGYQPTFLDAEGPNVVVQMFDGERVLATGPGPVMPGAKFDMLKHGWNIDDGSVKAKLMVRHEPVSIHLLARTADSSYYTVFDDDPKTEERPNAGYVYQLTSRGQLLRTFTLRNGGDKSPIRDVAVAADGTVYQMFVTVKTTKIYRIEPNP